MHSKLNTTKKGSSSYELATIIKATQIFAIVLLTLTISSALTLSKTPSQSTANAESSSVTASVTVENSCTMSGSIETNKAHSATVQSGSYTPDIGETLVSVNCNDSNGYSVYAIGFTGDVDGTTTLVGANTSLTIPTGTSTSTTSSNWAMKLSAVSGTSAPTILSDTNGSFASYHVVPSTATKVATLTSNTESSSSFKTTYAVAIGTSQPADTYTGQVKYTLVHPNNADADGTVSMTINDLTYMQDFATLTSTEKTQVLASMTEDQQYQLMDNRDNKSYYISKLADGNVWMTQNLDHDIVTTTDFYTYANTDIGHGTTPNTNATWTAQTATYATNDTTWSDSVDEPESYDPGDLCWNGTIRSDNKGTITTDTVACGNDKHHHIGNYYNWTAAVAMNDSSSYTTNQQDVDQSICPAGWRLPTYSGNKSYDNLVTALSLTSGTSGNVQSAPAYFVYGGYWYGESRLVGGSGYYWSSVVLDDSDAYEISFDRYGDMSPQDYDNRNNGTSVRCVAR